MAPITNTRKQKITEPSTQELEQLFNNNKNYCIQTFLQDLTPTESTVEGNQETKTHLKPSPPLRTSQGSWERAMSKKEHAFAEHLAEVLQPHPSENEPTEEEALIKLLGTTYQLHPPMKYLKRAEVKEVINNLNPEKSLGYDLITGKNS
jgi:hypothetical protein